MRSAVRYKQEMNTQTNNKENKNETQTTCQPSNRSQIRPQTNNSAQIKSKKRTEKKEAKWLGRWMSYWRNNLNSINERRKDAITKSNSQLIHITNVWIILEEMNKWMSKRMQAGTNEPSNGRTNERLNMDECTNERGGNPPPHTPTPQATGGACEGQFGVLSQKSRR